MLSSLLVPALDPSHGSQCPCTAVTESRGCSPFTTHSLALFTVFSWKSLERSFSEIIRWQILTFLCRTIDPHTAQPCWPASWAQLSPTRAGLDKLLEHKLLIFIKPRVFVRLPYNNNTFVQSFRNPSKKDCKDELAILSMFNVKRYCMHYLILSTWS